VLKLENDGLSISVLHSDLKTEMAARKRSPTHLASGVYVLEFTLAIVLYIYRNDSSRLHFTHAHNGRYTGKSSDNRVETVTISPSGPPPPTTQQPTSAPTPTPVALEITTPVALNVDTTTVACVSFHFIHSHDILARSFALTNSQ
jgi:hypothetical protein